MIRYARHDEIDFVRWDSAVDAGSSGMVYAKSWYLNIVSPGWEALVEDDYDFVFPLTTRKKFGISYLYQPPFTQQLGLFSKKEIATNKTGEFLAAIPNYFRLIEIQLNSANLLQSAAFSISKRLTHHLDLNSSYELIRKNYSDNLKRNLKRAHQNNLTVTSDFTITDLIDLFKSNRGKEIETLKPADYAVLERLVDEGNKKNLITKSGVIINGRLEAGAIFIRSNREFIFLFSATGEGAKGSGAMSFIIDNFISTHKEENMKLDFEGSMDPGLARFYKGFGAAEVVYLQIRKNNLPLLIRWLK